MKASYRFKPINYVRFEMILVLKQHSFTFMLLSPPDFRFL